MTIRVTVRARRDLAAIRAYVAAHDRWAAAALVRRLLDRMRTLETFPLAGRQVPEWPDAQVRELVEGNYRIVYRVAGDDIDVVTVFEGHRLLEPK